MSAHLFVPRGLFRPHPARSSRTHLRHLLALLLLLLSVLAAVPSSVCAADGGRRQQHNVWYSGLFISGIAVDEASGDVYFSDAAGNRVVRQAENGTVLHIWDADTYGWYSPMQLVHSDGVVWVADSTNSRVGRLMDDTVDWLPQSTVLHSCSALTLHALSQTLYVVDGWGLKLQPVNVSTQQWGEAVELWELLIGDYPPRYISWASMLPYPDLPDGPIWLPDPISADLLIVRSKYVYDFNFSTPGVSAMQLLVEPVGSKRNYTIYVLSQQAADQPMTVTHFTNQRYFIQQWHGTGRGGGAVPFYGWAMFVDSTASMYISDHGRHDDSSPYGRVVKLLPNGSEAGEWTMSDGVAYAFTSLAYYETPGSSECALWATEAEQGLYRLSANGTVLQPAYAAPIDPADNRTARLSGMAQDVGATDSTLVLLDSSDPSTTKLWRFSVDTHSYSLINTSALQLGANITGLAVDRLVQVIYLTDTNSRTVISLSSTGELIQSWNATQSGFVEPASLVLVSLPYLRLYMADSGYNGTGAVLLLDGLDANIPPVILPQSSPPMFRPLTIALDDENDQLYVADSNGLVFQYDLGSDPPVQTFLHQPVPAAHNVLSMTAGSASDMYLLDVYSRRVIILAAADTLAWTPQQLCLPPSPASSSTAFPALSSSSSSSGSALQPAAGSVWSVGAVVVLAVLGLLSVAGAASCVYMRRKRRSRSGGEMDEQLLAEQEEDEQVEEEKEKDVEVAHSPVALELQSGASASVAVPSAAWLPLDDAVEVDPTWHHSRAARYDYYVGRYEVIETLGDIEGRLQSKNSGRDMGTPLSTQAAQPTRTSSAASLSSTSSTSTESSSSSDSSSTHIPPVSHFVSSTNTPRHIARLESSWLSVPRFIDAVDDLHIIGEGSSGLVYSGTYSGVACVVKLPKSVSLTGAAWREWQCHLRLPPARSVVRFLGALPMSSTSYLVTALVRQGSLHSLLRSSTSCYCRPYGVMRCVRDMCAALRHMHSAGILHRDVSARNILVDSDGQYVLADLGLATLHRQVRQDGSADGSAVHSTRPSQPTHSCQAARHPPPPPPPTHHPTPHHTHADSLQTAVPVRWTSPEALACAVYSAQSDVWSLGVATWEMTAGGALPYGEQYSTARSCIRPIVAGQLTLHVDERWGRDSTSAAEQRLADTVRRVIHTCLTYECRDRPDSEQLCEMVDRWWDDWRQEAGDELAEIERHWHEHHTEVQRRLGKPVQVPDGW